MFSGIFNDLYEFDTDRNIWKNLTLVAKGIPPDPRYGHGFACVVSKLYVFSGFGNDGTFPSTSMFLVKLIPLPEFMFRLLE